MDSFPIQKLPVEYWPAALRHIPNPPHTLYYRGALPHHNHKFLCIIGPRKYTEYGAHACELLIKELRGFPITIVSGLAYGIDSIAHTCAIDAGLTTIAFPGSGLHTSVLYPRTHVNLALRILENGGALISEFTHLTEGAPWTFPKRNRLMAGMSDAVLVIEAGQKSGTMITSRLALDYNKNVLAVPGSIFSTYSIGTNNLIKDGATPITCGDDILWALGFNDNEIETYRKSISQQIHNDLHAQLNELEKIILNILTTPHTINQIAQLIHQPINIIIQTLTELELKNIIKKMNGYFTCTLPK